jgi:hypothetical protein
MSDVTMSTAASTTALSADSPQANPAAEPHSAFAADKELMLAALARMEESVVQQRAAHQRLRSELASVAEALAHAKKSVRNAATTGKPVNVNVLLTWLEARVHSMRTYLDPSGEPDSPPRSEPIAAAEPEPAQSEPVPTVSDVVSRLGRASDALAKEVASLQQSVNAVHDVPTPAVLGAMVEALTAASSAPQIARADMVEAQAELGRAPVEHAEANALPEPESADPATDRLASEAATEESALETIAEEQLSCPSHEDHEDTQESEDPEFELAPELLIVETPVTRPREEHAPTAEEIETPDEVAPATSPIAASAEHEPEPALGGTTAEILAAEQDVIVIETETSASEDEGEPPVPIAADERREEVPTPELVTRIDNVEATPHGHVPADVSAVSEPANTSTAIAAPVAAIAAFDSSAATTLALSQRGAKIQEFDLLSGFAAIEAMPFMQDDVGTAVIFEPRSDLPAAATQLGSPTEFETGAPAIEASASTPSVEDADQAAHSPAPAVTSELVSQEISIDATGEQPEISGISSDASEEVSATAADGASAAAESALEGVEQDLASFVAELTSRADAPANRSSALDAVEVPERAPVSELPNDAKAADDMEPANETAIVDAKLESDTTASVAAIALEATVSAASADTQSATDPGAHVVAGTAPVPGEVAANSGAKSDRLNAAEAALAQARAELAAAAALLDTTWPRLVEAKPAVQPALEAADDDLEDLFEPQPDAALDPNAVLLGAATLPAPTFALHPTTAAVLPVHEMALKPQSGPAAPEVTSTDVGMREPPKAPAPVDPLAPLKAMSDEEKIALFS